MPELIDPVQRRDLIRLGKRRIVENAVNEVLHRPPCAITACPMWINSVALPGVDAQNLMVLLMDQQLQPACRRCRPAIALCQFFILGDARFGR